MYGYAMSLKFSYEPERKAEWLITEMVHGEYASFDDPVVWSRAYIDDEDTGEYSWPSDMRLEYERLTGKAEFDGAEDHINIVEMMQDADDDCAWDQPCAHGHRVEYHAVYCHNKRWLYSPTKCRRGNWGSGSPHDKCPGFLANPLFKAQADRKDD